MGGRGVVLGEVGEGIATEPKETFGGDFHYLNYGFMGVFLPKLIK